MKINEVTNEARKVIKQLQNLYLSYVMNSESYDELLDFMARISDTTDTDILKEIAVINDKLYNEVISILRKQ